METYKVLLDPGHGGRDPGAVSQNSVHEADLVFDVARVVSQSLDGRKCPNDKFMIRTSLTRGEEDAYVSPTHRFNAIRQVSPHVFVSIHANASENPEATGTETIFRDARDYELAECVHYPLVRNLGLRDRGIKSDLLTLRRKLAVLNDGITPSILIELGFMSNPSDLWTMQAKTQEISDAIVEGVLDFLNFG